MWELNPQPPTSLANLRLLCHRGKLLLINIFYTVLIKYLLLFTFQAQFFWCVCHMLAIVFKPDCEYPRWTSAVFLPQNLFILILFVDFYIRTYIRKPREQQIAELKKKHTVTNGNLQKNGYFENSAKNNSKLKVLNEALNSLRNDVCDTDSRHLQNGTSIPNVMDIRNIIPQKRSSLNESKSQDETYHSRNERNILKPERNKVNDSQSSEIRSRGTSSNDKDQNHDKVE